MTFHNKGPIFTGYLTKCPATQVLVENRPRFFTPPNG